MKYLNKLPMTSVKLRRIREMNENNTKKFIEERKRQATNQTKQTDTLKKQHQGQGEMLNQDLMKVRTVRFLINLPQVQVPRLVIMKLVGK